MKRGLALIVGVGMTCALNVSTVRAGSNGEAQLSLPWAGHLNGTMTGGPHNWAGAQDPHHPWNSLDFVPSNGQVFAARDGYAYTNTDNNDCPTPGFIRLVHGDGYQTSYYHLDPNSIQIKNGQEVRRGTYLGNIGTSTPCGGSAQIAHVHFSLWYLSSGPFSLYSPPYNYNSIGVDWGGVSPSARGAGSQTQVGAWVLDDGAPPAQYYGCITPVTGGISQCPSTVLWSDWPSEQVPVARQPQGEYEDLLVRGFNLHGWRDANANPLNWSDFGGVYKGSPTGVWNASATQLDLFGVGTDDRVWHRSVDSSGTWSAWTTIPLTGTLGLSGSMETETVNVDRRPYDGGMDIFVRGLSGDAQHATLDSSANLVGSWESLGGYVKGAPTGRWDSGQSRLDVFGIGSDDHAWHRAQIARLGWQPWEGPLAISAASAGTEVMMAVRAPDDTMDLLYSGTAYDASRQRADRSGNLTGSPQSLGGLVKGAPDGKWNAAQTELDVFVIGANPDNQIWEATVTSGGVNWYQLSGGWG